MDFYKGKWPAHPLDGYLVTTALVTAIFFLHLISPECRYLLAFLAAFIMSGIQLGRLWAVLSDRYRFSAKGHGDLVSPAYFYSYTLAHRRGIPAVKETEEKSASENTTGAEQGLPDEDEEENEEVRTTRSRTNLWRQEFMDTYRHLREHGNSAFIFVLEVALAALVYCVLTKPGQTPAHQIGAIGLLFAIWAAPSVFVHLLAQHLERRFSRYDQKLKSGLRHSS